MLADEVSAADLEQFQMWLEYQKPMPMGICQDMEGIHSTCGRCGAKLTKVMTSDGPKVMDMRNWPKYCPKCGQRVKRGEDDE